MVPTVGWTESIGRTQSFPPGRQSMSQSATYPTPAWRRDSRTGLCQNSLSPVPLSSARRPHRSVCQRPTRWAAAMLGVMNHPVGVASPNRHFECRQHRLGVETRFDRPVHNLARERAERHRQIKIAGPDCSRVDVSDSQPIRRCGAAVAGDRSWSGALNLPKLVDTGVRQWVAAGFKHWLRSRASALTNR
jgi:hypothetical protein